MQYAVDQKRREKWHHLSIAIAYLVNCFPHFGKSAPKPKQPALFNPYRASPPRRGIPLNTKAGQKALAEWYDARQKAKGRVIGADR